jgi:hypothetical protein
MPCRRSDCTHRILAAAVMAAAMAMAAPARADETPEAIFADAKKLLQAGKTAEACDRLAAAVKGFEANGAAKQAVVASLNLADCREQNQQLATAWALFLKTATAAQNAGQRPVATEARKRAGLLQPRLSYLTVSVPDANRVEGLVVSRDGAAIDPSMWNQGVPVDGGTYAISATSPGSDEWSTKAVVPAQSGKVVIEVPRMKRIRDLPVIGRKPQPEPEKPEPIATTSKRRMTPLQWAGIGTGGAGVVALGAGIYFGMKARSISDEASDWGTFMPDRYAEGEDAETYSAIAFGVGAACVIGGGVLFYLGYRSSHESAPDEGAEGAEVAVTPWVSPDALGVGAMGRF